jgi:mono/diheme cytochrome c family protein
VSTTGFYRQLTLRLAFKVSVWLLLLSPATLTAQEKTPALEETQAIRVRKLLRERCGDCHGAETRESGLRLDIRKGIEKGGDFGPVVLPGKPDQSELLRRVTTDNEEKAMPPDGDRLEEEEVALLRDWIAAGAPWPSSAKEEAEERDPRLDHWAWQALKSPTPPAANPEWKSNPKLEPEQNPIDLFVRAKLAAEKLSPAPAADRRTLIRRLYFDLHGLPPSPEEIDAFVADPDPQAYEKLVDRLLASPRYGERWARHWLDVVHYGDTHGYDKDQPRPNAWPYRDYVIRALNEDKPYARFIEEQIAGDVLYPDTRDGQEAVGMIAAGPWDLIGHLEVPETKTDGKIARHLDRDDMVANTIGTFNSVTIHCAQCHQHKFDPITQEDYYSLQAVFAAIDRDEREYSPDPAIQKQLVELKQRIRNLQQRRDQLTKQLAEQGGEQLAQIDKRIAEAGRGASSAQGGYHSQIEAAPSITKWVQIDLGSPQEILNVVLHPCYDDFNGIGAGFGFPLRYRIEASDDPEFGSGVTLVSDHTAGEVPNPGVAAQSHPAEAKAQYVRVTATQLVPRANDYIFALAEIEVLSPGGENLALGKTVSSLDSIEAPTRWTRGNAVDGLSPARAAIAPKPLQAERSELLAAKGLSALSDELTKTSNDLVKTEAERKSLQPIAKVYAATTHKRSGQPRTIHLLARGNVLTPMQEVSPGTLALLEMLPSRFELPADHSEGDRRVALAKWLSDSNNPLTWRSIVNRVWQYHFGQGIVATPNDFGLMGTAPTHPELLDWLSIWFRDNGGSLKSLHKLIVMSSTYRQSSAPREECLASDSDNRFLWRQTPRRLEAEAIRDAVLSVSGSLDLAMGGPGWQDFKIEHPEHSPHYEYELANPEDRSLWRRSVYRFIVRSQTQPFMTVLDCADPSMRVDRRNQSISALQALALLNNGLMLVQAKEFANRVTREAGQELSAQVTRAYQLAVGRDPDDAERDALIALGKSHGLENVCRTLFNLNEFVWID